MFAFLKKFWLLLALLLAGAQSIFGFSVLGPPGSTGAGREGWQQATIGYNLPGDVATPRNLGDEYRWNIPTVYYAYDATFLNYFGSNGVAAVDAAFAMFNNLSNVSSYSTNLAEWPLTSSRYNYSAQNLSLLDLKSATMGLICEQLALGEPSRWAWCLHDKYTPNPCPNYEYTIVQRNYDPVTQSYSEYVNGTLYDYVIFETCLLSPNPYPFTADTIPIAVDPLTSESAVAENALNLGQFYTGLTRDDVGGLRYLYAATNKFVEVAGSNSFQLFTNQMSQLLVTSNLALLTAQSLTNNQAGLQAIYPDIVITNPTNFFSNVVTTNITAYFTNLPLAPAGTISLVLATNFTTNVATLFGYTFANVVTNHHYTKGFITTQSTNISFKPLAPAGTLVTNVTSKTIFTNFVNGDFYIIPTNLCGFQIIHTQLVTVIPITNVVVIATNAVGVNAATNTQSFVMNIITYFTNFNYIVYPVDCVTNSLALREGVEKITFVRRDFDSLLGNTWSPITNTYHLTAVSNTAIVQTFKRVVTIPDIIISAADLASGPTGIPAVPYGARTIPNFNTSLLGATNAGPGTIQPQISFVYDKVGPIYLNGGPFFVEGGPVIFYDTNSILDFVWGSFDGSTNAPTVYPTNSSLASLQAQVFFQITSGLLSNGSISQNNAGNPYSFQLQATGGSPPYVWALASNSPGLPSGLNLSSGGLISGSLSSAAVGTYDFTVQVTDFGSRTTQAQLSIRVNP